MITTALDTKKKTYSGSETRRRNVVRTMRFDAAEQIAIDAAAADAGVSVSELIRRAVLRDIGFQQVI